jgi:tetratricopeptide (TPR) repeat protein
LLERGVALAPDSVVGLRHLASLYLARGRRAEAEDTLRRAARSDPRDSTRMLAEVLCQRGDIQAAESLLRGTLARTPKEAATHFALADLLASQGRAPEAIAQLEQGADLLPRERAAASIRIGQTLLRCGQIDGAAQAFGNVPQNDPLHHDALLGLIDALKRDGQIHRAAAVLEHLTATVIETSLDSKLLCKAGWALRHLPDPTTAEVVFRRAIEVDPGNDQARIGLADTLNHLERPDEALAILRTMAAAGSIEPETYVHLGGMLYARSDLDGAETAFIRAIQLAPAWTQLNESLATVRRDKQAASTMSPY